MKHYINFPIIVCFFLFLAGCAGEGSDPIGTEDDGPSGVRIANCAAQCGEVIDPVCGLDGEVYLSACVAECAGIAIDNSADCQLCKFPIDEYRKRGLQKVRLLNEYISVILDKRPGKSVAANASAEVDTAINDAVRLFVSEDAQVEVVGSNSHFFTIRDYLNRIKNYSYGKVDIAWSDIGYVSDVKKGPDGHYYWTVTVTQVFRGYNKESQEPEYVDVTRKNIEVILKTYTISREGRIDLDCEVYLSDIGVKDMRTKGNG